MTEDRIEHEGMALEKRAARAAVRAAVLSIPAAARRLASGRVCARLMARREFASARTVMLFAPLTDEVDLTPVLERCRLHGRRVCVARADWDRREMEPVEVGGTGGMGWEALIPARFGVREPPSDAPVVRAGEIDLVVVPGVAFDHDCHRLGRGGGFYDRFLARAELRRAFLVGVGFSVQLVAKVPRADHDRPVDAVITDEAIIAR